MRFRRCLCILQLTVTSRPRADQAGNPAGPSAGQITSAQRPGAVSRVCGCVQGPYIMLGVEQLRSSSRTMAGCKDLTCKELCK